MIVSMYILHADYDADALPADCIHRPNRDVHPHRMHKWFEEKMADGRSFTFSTWSNAFANLVFDILRKAGHPIDQIVVHRVDCEGAHPIEVTDQYILGEGWQIGSLCPHWRPSGRADVATRGPRRAHKRRTSNPTKTR